MPKSTTKPNSTGSGKKNTMKMWLMGQSYGLGEFYLYFGVLYFFLFLKQNKKKLSTR
jgi:hypothetical protein